MLHYVRKTGKSFAISGILGQKIPASGLLLRVDATNSAKQQCDFSSFV